MQTESEKEVVEVNLEGEKERETKGQYIFVKKDSNEKYFLVERRELALKVKECKQE